VQPQGEVRDLPGRPGGCVPGLGVALAQLGRHHLLDQVGFPVGCGLDRSQVPGLHPVLAERGHSPGNRQGIRSVLPADPADQAVVLELDQLLVVDSRRLQQLAPGHVGRNPAGPVAADSGQAAQSARAARRRGAISEPFPDHLQREVGIPLHGEDVTQPLDVGRREPAVTRSRPGRLDQPLVLQEADLGRADVGKFRAQLPQHFADTELAARGLIAHARPLTRSPARPCREDRPRTGWGRGSGW
jgi:hypothetical protein